MNERFLVALALQVVVDEPLSAGMPQKAVTIVLAFPEAMHQTVLGMPLPDIRIGPVLRAKRHDEVVAAHIRSFRKIRIPGERHANAIERHRFGPSLCPPGNCRRPARL
nr:hypothetical protein DBT53_10320 [Aerococcus mictus]